MTRQETIYALSSQGYFPSTRLSNHPTILRANQRNIHLSYIRCNQIFKGQSTFFDPQQEDFYKKSRSLPSKGIMGKSQITMATSEANDQQNKNTHDLRLMAQARRCQPRLISRSFHAGSSSINKVDPTIKNHQRLKIQNSKKVYQYQQTHKLNLPQNLQQLETFKSQHLGNSHFLDPNEHAQNKKIRSLIQAAKSLQNSYHLQDSISSNKQRLLSQSQTSIQLSTNNGNNYYHNSYQLNNVNNNYSYNNYQSPYRNNYTNINNKVHLTPNIYNNHLVSNNASTEVNVSQFNHNMRENENENYKNDNNLSTSSTIKYPISNGKYNSYLQVKGSNANTGYFQRNDDDDTKNQSHLQDTNNIQHHINIKSNTPKKITLSAGPVKIMQNQTVGHNGIKNSLNSLSQNQIRIQTNQPHSQNKSNTKTSIVNQPRITVNRQLFTTPNIETSYKAANNDNIIKYNTNQQIKQNHHHLALSGQQHKKIQYISYNSNNNNSNVKNNDSKSYNIINDDNSLNNVSKNSKNGLNDSTISFDSSKNNNNKFIQLSQVQNNITKQQNKANIVFYQSNTNNNNSNNNNLNSNKINYQHQNNHNISIINNNNNNSINNNSNINNSSSLYDSQALTASFKSKVDINDSEQSENDRKFITNIRQLTQSQHSNFSINKISQNQQLNKLRMQLARKQRQLAQSKHALQNSQKKNRSLQMHIKKIQTNLQGSPTNYQKYGVKIHSNSSINNSNNNLNMNQNLTCNESIKCGQELQRQLNGSTSAFLYFTLLVVMIAKQMTGV